MSPSEENIDFNELGEQSVVSQIAEPGVKEIREEIIHEHTLFAEPIFYIKDFNSLHFCMYGYELSVSGI